MRECDSVLGPQAEELAYQFLLEQGFEVLSRNYVCALGELDLVARKAEQLHFVEVKASSDALGEPEYRVNRPKQRKLRTLAHHFTREFQLLDLAAQFDIIAVRVPKGGAIAIDHFEDAFDGR